MLAKSQVRDAKKDIPFPRPSITRMECGISEAVFSISSRAGLKSTWPKVSHLLTVMDPTLKLTCETGVEDSWAAMEARRDDDREPLLEDFESLELWEECIGFFAAELFRSPYPEKKSVNDIGVVGDGIAARASLALGFTSVL